jgi:hypothetical protein
MDPTLTSFVCCLCNFVASDSSELEDHIDFKHNDIFKERVDSVDERQKIERRRRRQKRCEQRQQQQQLEQKQELSTGIVNELVSIAPLGNQEETETTSSAAAAAAAAVTEEEEEEGVEPVAGPSGVQQQLEQKQQQQQLLLVVSACSLCVFQSQSSKEIEGHFYLEHSDILFSYPLFGRCKVVSSELQTEMTVSILTMMNLVKQFDRPLTLEEQQQQQQKKWENPQIKEVDYVIVQKTDPKFICRMCNNKYQLDRNLQKHIKSKHIDFLQIIQNEVSGQLTDVKRKLDVEVGEVKYDVKRLRSEVVDLRKRQDFKDTLDIARIAENSDAITNNKRKAMLLFSGLINGDNDRSMQTNNKRVQNCLQVNFSHIEFSIVKVSFLHKKKKEDILKVEFANEEQKNEILSYTLENNIQGIFDFVTFDTIIRRKILNILASKLREIADVSIKLEVPTTGALSVLIVLNEEADIRDEISFVDAVAKFSGFLAPNKELQEIYNTLAALDKGENIFQKFIVFEFHT